VNLNLNAQSKGSQKQVLGSAGLLFLSRLPIQDSKIPRRDCLFNCGIFHKCVVGEGG